MANKSVKVKMKNKSDKVKMVNKSDKVKMVNKSDKVIMPMFLYIIAILYVFIFTIINPAALIGTIIAVFCARQCYIYSIKMKINPYMGFVAGLFFSIFGLLAYYLMFRYKTNKKKEEERIKEEMKK